jgi:ribulose kinase
LPVNRLYTSPYASAILPYTYLLSGGQSATGALLDYILDTHTQSNTLKQQAQAKKMHITEFIYHELQALATARQLANLSYLTRDLHVDSNFHGNRSPLADSSLLGAISGLSLSHTTHDLCILYLATLQSIIYGTKHIIDTMNENGCNIQCLIVTGGIGKNSLAVQLHADICQLPIVLPTEPDSVLIGVACAAAKAAGIYPTLSDAMKAMSTVKHVIHPNRDDTELIRFHNNKYAVYRQMIDDQKRYKQIMNA